MLETFQSIFSPPRHLILLVAAAWLGLFLAERRALRHALSQQMLNNLIFYGIIAYILGGRILFAAEHLSSFVASPLGLFSINPDLFDSVGAAIAGILAAWAYGRREKLEAWSTLDALVPFFGTLAVGLAVAHLASGEAFGQPTRVPWGVELWSAIRHPSQIYELLAALAILGLLWWLPPPTHPGQLFLSFSAVSAAARLLLEAWRGDSALIAGGFRQAQLLAWLVLAACFVLVEYRQRVPLSPLSPESPPAKNS